MMALRKLTKMEMVVLHQKKLRRSSMLIEFSLIKLWRSMIEMVMASWTKTVGNLINCSREGCYVTCKGVEIFGGYLNKTRKQDQSGRDSSFIAPLKDKILKQTDK